MAAAVLCVDMPMSRLRVIQQKTNGSELTALLRLICLSPDHMGGYLISLVIKSHRHRALTRRLIVLLRANLTAMSSGHRSIMVLPVSAIPTAPRSQRSTQMV